MLIWLNDYYQVIKKCTTWFMLIWFIDYYQVIKNVFSLSNAKTINGFV